MRLCTFWVPGIPASQGSKDLVRVRLRSGAVVTRMVESSNRGATRKLEAWRHAVGWCAKLKYQGVPAEGPMLLQVNFRFVRPRTGEGAKRAEPDIKPDLSKLIRAIEDAMTAIIWKDDAQVVRIEASKAYGAEPGAQITVTRYMEGP